MTTDLERLQTALKENYKDASSEKVAKYINQFRERTYWGTTIAAKVEGNHGTYTVSIQLKDDRLMAACSCYIGKGGHCHHCAALAITFMRRPTTFIELPLKSWGEVEGLADLPDYLRATSLESLLAELKKHGITQKAFAEAIGASTQHVSAVKRSELRNHYFHELGAMKLACLWVLEKFAAK